MATTLLGLIGKKQSGKDSFASRLVSEHGFTRLAFADPLKDIALELNPIMDTDVVVGERIYLVDLIDLYGWDEAKETFPEVRELLQRLGVSVRNHVSENVWIQALAEKAYRTPGPVVVSDCRFLNEARWIRGQGGETVRIIRPGQDNADRHISETELDAWVAEHRVINDGTVADLHFTVDHIATDLFLRGLSFPSHTRRSALISV